MGNTEIEALGREVAGLGFRVYFWGLELMVLARRRTVQGSGFRVSFFCVLKYLWVLGCSQVVGITQVTSRPFHVKGTGFAHAPYIPICYSSTECLYSLLSRP